jgi:hypothetical protein
LRAEHGLPVCGRFTKEPVSSKRCRSIRIVPNILKANFLSNPTLNFGPSCTCYFKEICTIAKYDRIARGLAVYVRDDISKQVTEILANILVPASEQGYFVAS